MVDFKDSDFGNREMVGEIISVHFDKAEENCQITNKPSKSDQLHFVIKSLDHPEWKDQNWWLGDSMSIGAAWYEVVKQFKRLDVITDETVKDSKTNFELAKNILSMVKGVKFKFDERRLGRRTKATWFPVSKV